MEKQICVMMKVHRSWGERGGLRALMTMGLMLVVGMSGLLAQDATPAAD